MFEQRLKELKNVGRIVMNLQNLVSDCDIKGSLSPAVHEILQWLNAFQKNVEIEQEVVQGQINRQAPYEQQPVEMTDNHESAQPSQGSVVEEIK